MPLSPQRRYCAATRGPLSPQRRYCAATRGRLRPQRTKVTPSIPLLDNYSNDFVPTRYADGTLTLNFTDQGAVTTLAADTPYIIKWASGDNLVSPTFTDVTIPDGYTDTEAINTALTAAVSTTYADFRGTYAPIDFTEDDRTKLFLGTANTLYYPKSGAHIGSQCAYFQLNGLTAGDVTNARIFFGDDDITGITTTDCTDFTDSNDAWYSLDGRKLAVKPTKKGLYINGGRKVVIK